MSSPYSSLDWVLSHTGTISLRTFICVCVCIMRFLYTAYYCNTVGWTSANNRHVTVIDTTELSRKRVPLHRN